MTFEITPLRRAILKVCWSAPANPKMVFRELEGEYSYNYVANSMNQLHALGLLEKSPHMAYYMVKNYDHELIKPVRAIIEQELEFERRRKATADAKKAAEEADQLLKQVVQP